jgi:hypothetical protein
MLFTEIIDICRENEKYAITVCGIIQSSLILQLIYIYLNIFTCICIYLRVFTTGHYD